MTNFHYNQQKAGTKPLERGCVSLIPAALSQDILLVSCKLSVLSKLMHTWLYIGPQRHILGHPALTESPAQEVASLSSEGRVFKD